VVPVHNRAGLTRQCLDKILAEPPAATFEIIVVDDASADETASLLSAYRKSVRAIPRAENGGFATACNDGAAAATGEYLVFLNNDTIPVEGWLDALVSYADADRARVVVGSKLLFPNDTIQHAGVVICQDGSARHIYAGFPADHPVVNRSRQFQAVTAACMLVRREVFEEAGGFDSAYRNCLEDADLCLRLREAGGEVHYCHESVLYHLESVSRGRRSREIAENTRLFRSRWDDRAERDDLRYYLEDGLLRIRYRDVYPLKLEISPELAGVPGLDEDATRFLELQSQQVADLLRETVRLTAEIADLDLPADPGPAPGPKLGRLGSILPRELQSIVLEAEQLELGIHELQEKIAAAGNGALAESEATERRVHFVPGDKLSYAKMKERIRDLVDALVPEGVTVVVVSRGDDDLLDLGNRIGWHFPQEDDGTYRGHHPETSREAIAELEELRNRGARYLLVPDTDVWWLKHYEGLADHLGEHYRRLTREGAACQLFELERGSRG
jgi:GT2 family glycosyltransferase